MLRACAHSDIVALLCVKVNVIFLNVEFAFIIGISDLKTGYMIKICVTEFKTGFALQMNGKKCKLQELFNNCAK